MLPGQIGLLVLGLVSVLLLAVLGLCSYLAWKKEKQRAARRAKRKPLLEPEETPVYEPETPVYEPETPPAPPADDVTQGDIADVAAFFDDAAHTEAPKPEAAAPQEPEGPAFVTAGDLDWSFLEDAAPVGTSSSDDDGTPPVSFDFKF